MKSGSECQGWAILISLPLVLEVGEWRRADSDRPEKTSLSAQCRLWITAPQGLDLNVQQPMPMVEQRYTLGELRRRKKKLTQQSIADALGVTSKAVSSWERGVTEPHLTPLQTQKMMELYGCRTIDELVWAVDASMDEYDRANPDKV